MFTALGIGVIVAAVAFVLVIIRVPTDRGGGLQTRDEPRNKSML